ncbi:MAG TPA: hypothetical protein VGG20_28840 [Thermoanaerobaculia bacterium]|jgi:hypothetical protein
MKRWMTVGLLTVAVLLPAGMAQAQGSNDRHDRDRDDEEEGHRGDRFALGVGVGLVEPLNKTETYYMASLRIRTSGRGGDGRDEGRRRDEGITGYLEPEVGYWKSSDNNRPKGSDLLLGVNLIGVVPLGAVDSFFGVGAGAHFIDASLAENDTALTGRDTKFGANAQFGIDLYINRKLSAFGTGRFDLVQGSSNRIQSKVYLGLRGRF